MSSMPRQAVITLGIDSRAPAGHPARLFQNYRLGIERLRTDLKKFGFAGDFLAWADEFPPGSPRHDQIEYAFKPFCFEDARRRGYELVLWLDTSIVLRRPLDDFFALIAAKGYLIFENWHSLGEYCKDEALAPLGLTRETAFELPSCLTGALGLDLRQPVALEFLRQWRERAVDGVTFPGAKWSGIRGWPRTVSTDPRVKGHRHDQAAASAIAWHLGMRDWQPLQALRANFAVDRALVRRLDEYPEA